MSLIDWSILLTTISFIVIYGVYKTRKFNTIKDHLKGVLSLNQAKELINIKTRQYAKRQVTWARGHMHDWDKHYSNSFSSLSKKILKVIS